ncbi:hypothetical protein JTP67_02940 [Streptomyces sp. S12]|nr:hypothetical protein [Streptomyces sp. S12]
MRDHAAVTAPRPRSARAAGRPARCTRAAKPSQAARSARPARLALSEVILVSSAARCPLRGRHRTPASHA